MVQYYWNPNIQQAVPRPGMQMPMPGMQTPGMQMPMPGMQTPGMQFPGTQFPGVPPTFVPVGGRDAVVPGREQSFIENILRLNIGNPGTFHFSFEHAVRSGINTLAITGVVEAAGRDHAIIKDSTTNSTYLLPMIYFDFAEFPGDVKYFDQTPR